VLCKTGNRILVKKDDETLLDIQCHKIETILIFGNVQFTTQAVHELFKHNIELALLTVKGRLVGQLTPIMPKNIKLRMAQYESYNDSAFRLSSARAIVAGKIHNSLAHVRSFTYYHKDKNLKPEIESLKLKLDSVDNFESVEKLMGLEGSAARVYFKAFGKMIISEGLTFTERKKHPAPDPVNALLSFGYTLLFNEINSFLDGIGFDPYIGIYHEIDYGRPSLACDLIEEFRAPIIDRFTLSLINGNNVSADDFYYHNPSGSMYLKRESLKSYLEKYEHLMMSKFSHHDMGEDITFRQAMRNQVGSIGKTFTEGEKYKPLRFSK